MSKLDNLNAQPIVGILFALIGIGFVVYGIKYKEPEPVQASTGSETQQRIFLYDERRTIMVYGFDYTYEDKYYRIATDSTPVKAGMVFEW